MEDRQRYTLGKDQRIKRRKYIEELFNSGESFSIYPLRVYYLVRHDDDIDDETPDWKERISEPILQFGCGVSKKHFKKAVDRNRIKRLLRETYRLGNSGLEFAIAQKKELCLKMFILYVGKEMPTYELIEQKVQQALLRLEKKLENT